jgi:putrescine transport system substrate-binding protein
VDAKRSYEIRFANAKEGGLIWFDIMGIPKDAPHPEAALAWINYIEDPKVNAGITNEVFYPTPNKAARAFVTASVANDAGVYPAPDVLAKMTMMKALPADILRLENRLWAQLKTGH